MKYEKKFRKNICDCGNSKEIMKFEKFNIVIHGRSQCGQSESYYVDFGV